jgi:tetratricopeptide (TPR) repeat protein
MKKVNTRLVLILVGVVVGGAIGVFFLHRFQVARNAGGLAKLARTKLAEGKSGEALALFGRYVAYRPEDKAAYAEYAGLVLDRAESPGATRNDVSRAYSVLETAVRRNPDDDALRQRLAEFQLRIGRFGDAREHLQILRSKVSGTPAAPTADDASHDKPEAKPLDRTRLDLLLARSWAGTGDFAEAAALASDLIAFDLQHKAFDPEREAAPHSTDAYTLLAAILQEKFSDPGTADRVLTELVKTNAEDPEAWVARARWHRERGDLAAAKEDLAQAGRLAPENIAVILASFDVAVAEKDFAAAGHAVDAGMKLAADDERVIRAAAVLALKRQQPADAVAVLDRGLSALPGSPTLLMMLADSLLMLNEIERGEQTIGRLAKVLGPANPAVGLLEARVLIARQRWLQAREKLDRVRPLAAGSTDLARQIDLYLGQCHEQLGEFDEQLEANRRVLSDDPTSLAARVGAASALIAAGRPDEALQEFEAVAAAIPRDRIAAIPQLWNPLLQLRIAAQLKRPAADRDWTVIDGLLDTLRESADISDSQIALLRADVLARKGESAAAGDLLEKASQANPREPQLLAALATLAVRENDAERARAVLARAPEDLAADAGLLLTEAQVASRSPPAEAARQLIAVEARVATLPPDVQARVLSSLASIRISMGQPAEAERLWTAALEKTPEDPRLRWTLYELARERGDLDAMQRISGDIAKTLGATSPQARVARAGGLIEDVRKSQQKGLAKDQPAINLTADDRRMLDEARNLLIEAENDRPGWAQIQLMFADIARLRGDVSASIDHLQRASRMGPANAAIIRQLVGLLYESNRFAEAQQAIARMGPEGLVGAERITAEMELRSGNVDEAVSLAERSVSSDSKNAGELLWLGQLLGRSGKSDRAETVLERAVEQAPDLAEAWMALFSHQVATGNRGLAEKTLERAAASLAEPSRQLVPAQGYEMLGRLEDAERNYRSALEAAPSDSLAARELASFLIRRGRLGPARDVLRDIIAVKEDSPAAQAAKIWARRALAQITAEAGGFKRLEEAFAILDGNKDSGGNLGPDDVALQVTLLAGRPEPASWRRAITLLENLRRSQPLSSNQRLQLAQLRERTGRWIECRDEMMSLAAVPNAPPAFVGLLVERLIEHGELSSAKTWLGKLRATNPDAPATLALEAKLAMAEKDRPTAVAAARKLMPTGDLPLEQTGQLLAVASLMEKLGFPKAADKLLDEYARRLPEGALSRAEFLGRQNRVAEALDLLETAWGSLPLPRILQSALAVIRSPGGPPDAAVSDRLEHWFTRARREDPEAVAFELMHSELLEIQGRSSEIDKVYRQILQRKDLAGPELAIVANNLAFHLARPETAAEAKRLIDDAIAELGPHPDLLDTRGVVLLAAGDAPGALAALEEAVLDPTPVKLLHLAAAQVATKDLTAARATLDRARSLGLLPEQLGVADKDRYDAVEAALSPSPGA